MTIVGDPKSRLEESETERSRLKKENQKSQEINELLRHFENKRYKTALKYAMVRPGAKLLWA